MARPANLPARYRNKWDQPWKPWARLSPGFRKWLDQNGYITPHFRWEEAKCKDGTHVPASLRGNAVRHAWQLERFRHRLGDKSIPVLSWYRSPSYNRKIGGASKSQHMNALATDFSTQVINRIGRGKFFAEAEKVWKTGGVGKYPSGSGHTDTRGWRARWSSF